MDLALPRGRRIALRPLIPFAVATTGVLSVLALVFAWFASGHLPGDAVTYAAAGQRLNAGHEIYRLLPGDSPVLMEPPYPPYPLLSPPLIAVVFRPLALLPDLMGAWLWFGVMAIGLGLALSVLLRATPIVVGPALLALCFPLAVLVGVGNVDALVIAGGVAAWLLLAHGRDASAGVVIGLLVSLKLTPVVLAWWLLVQARGKALLAVGATGVVLAAVTVLGSDRAVFGEYLEVIGTAIGIAPGGLSLAGLGRLMGLPVEVAALLPRVAVVAGLALIVALRGRPASGWVVAGLLLWLGSPAAASHTPALALVALAPLAARLRVGSPVRPSPAVSLAQTSADAQ